MLSLGRDAAGSGSTLTMVRHENTQLGPYKIEGLLGAGGMGKVYWATDTRLNRKVAVKITEERFSGRFEREARAISAFNHPNICTLYDVGPNYLVMELLDGSTLADDIKKGPLAIEQVARYGAQIAAALAEAHAHGIVHRDLKPGNIMVTRHGVKVLDFGLAKMASEAGPDGSRCGDGNSDVHGSGAAGGQRVRCAHGHVRSGAGAVCNGGRETAVSRKVAGADAGERRLGRGPASGSAACGGSGESGCSGWEAAGEGPGAALRLHGGGGCRVIGAGGTARGSSGFVDSAAGAAGGAGSGGSGAFARDPLDRNPGRSVAVPAI